jgi:hypothetical protein
MFPIFRRVVVPLVLFGLTIAGLINTYADASDVEKLAGREACGGTACPVQMTEFSRSPFSHEYVFAVGKSLERVSVKCARQYVFVGDYSCARH